MAIVLDASTALAWAFRDEREQRAEHALEAISIEGAIVPAFWHYEVANGLSRGESAGRIEPSDRARFVSALATFEIHVADSSWDQVFTDVARFALEYGLSVYDASYLELAVRLELPLAALDRSLERAARQAGVGLLA